MYNLRAPVAKRCFLPRSSPLPTFENGVKLENPPHYAAKFNGFNVTLDKYEDMIDLYTKGFFGKGSLSAGFPSHDRKLKNLPDVSSELGESSNMKSENVSVTTEKSNTGNLSEKVLQVLKEVNAAGAGDTNVQQQLNFILEEATTEEGSSSNKCEQLHLMLEEAFFLSSVLNCLDIFYKGQLMSNQSMWAEFQNVRSDFVERYLSYQHFRTKGWVVKSGIKFGCDFVLYKDGPPFYHASYVVAVISNITEESMNQEFETFLTRHRITEAANKELLICRVTAPENYDKRKVDDMKSCTISEFIFQRWTPEKNRE